MKRHPFSMVEILLALGVVAIGICSVMVLFPVGASATRDAAMETYAANAADQILHMVKYKLTMTDGDQWIKSICSSTAPYSGLGIYSDTTPDSSSIEDFDDTTKWKDSCPLIGGTTLQGSGIFTYDDEDGNDNDNHFYQIIVHRGNPEDNFSTVMDKVTDFRALATLWASKVTIPSSGTDVELPLNFATRLNLKIEWPVELPQSARQSAYYTLEVFKNK